MEIRYRLRPRQLVWGALVWPSLSFRLVMGLPWRYQVFFVVVTYLGIAGLLRSGVALRPDALVLRRYRTTRVPWEEVTSVVTAMRFGSKYVKVSTPDKTWSLPAPVHSSPLMSDPDFDEKTDTIRRYWQERRSALVG